MTHTVAVYGSLRKSLGNHRLLEQAKFLGTDEIPNFIMYSLGGFPYIRPTPTDSTIHIEVYSVTDEEFARLDRLEGYPNFYDRKQVDTAYGKAWIYFIDKPPAGNPEVTSGDWLKYYKENSRAYSY